MTTPKLIWWVQPRKLCVMQRPGGGGRSHRPARREAELAWLRERGVRVIVSTMRTRHNLRAYEEAGFEWRHVPVPDGPDEWPAALEEVLRVLRRELRRRGAVALHGNRNTDFVAAAGAVHRARTASEPPEELLEAAAGAGLQVTEDSRRLTLSG